MATEAFGSVPRPVALLGLGLGLGLRFRLGLGFGLGFGLGLAASGRLVARFDVLGARHLVEGSLGLELGSANPNHPNPLTLTLT